MSSPFISEADVEAELSEVTTRRLLDDAGDGTLNSVRLAQLRTDACARVTALIKGYQAPIPSAVEAPLEWKRLALRWLIAQLAIDYPGFFRLNGLALLAAVEREILTARAAEPTDNQVHVASVPFGPWGGPWC